MFYSFNFIYKKKKKISTCLCIRCIIINELILRTTTNSSLKKKYLAENQDSLNLKLKVFLTY
jgi:hypothetical protein